MSAQLTGRWLPARPTRLPISPDSVQTAFPMALCVLATRNAPASTAPTGFAPPRMDLDVEAITAITTITAPTDSAFARKDGVRDFAKDIKISRTAANAGQFL